MRRVLTLSLNINSSHKKLTRSGLERGDCWFRLDCNTAGVVSRSTSEVLSLGGTLSDNDGNQLDETLSLLPRLEVRVPVREDA